MLSQFRTNCGTVQLILNRFENASKGLRAVQSTGETAQG